MNSASTQAASALPAERGLLEFPENMTCRWPCVFLVDTSSSMKPDALEKVREWLGVMYSDVRKDPLLARSMDLAVVAFGSQAHVALDFSLADVKAMPQFFGSGPSYSAAGILLAMDLLTTRIAIYRSQGTPYYRPWLVAIGDGSPADAQEVQIKALSRLQEAQRSEGLSTFIVRVEDAGAEHLGSWSRRPPLRLRGLKFPAFVHAVTMEAAETGILVPAISSPVMPTNALGRRTAPRPLSLDRPLQEKCP